ncbi:MAG: hypothetical protein BWY19_00206 [bacterium ADurb.Bin212]|nr:MAG: hypothetical protein BWY19_00206 [bacterium ADurb.Bin212]
MITSSTISREYTKAVIYCRVSSEKQVKEGNGLDSQEYRCRAYADSLKLKVDKVFRDEGISGGLFDRPAMKSMIDYLDDHWQSKYCVIFDDLKRFARDVEVHLRLKSELRCREAKLCCLSYNFDDSAEGEFVETIFAAQNELERKQNRRQVCQKMKARMENGYWCFHPPVGYEYKKDREHGKIIVPIPEIASIITEGLEAFANERLVSQTDVIDFFISKGLQNMNGGKKLKFNKVKRILKQSVYAGIIDYPLWGISRRKGHHKAIVSVQTFDKIQERLRRPERKPRETDKLEFPLRRYVNCSVCGKKMTGSVNRGKSKYYAHYTCNNKECSARPKNISVQKLEDDYVKLLEEIGVEPEILKLGEIIALKTWEKKSKDVSITAEKREAEKKEMESKLDSYIDLVANARSDTIRNRYEEKIEELDQQIKRMENELKNKKTPDIGGALKLLLRFLGTPAETWKNSNRELKIALQNMIFAENPTYSLKDGFGTPKLSLPFLLKHYIDGQSGGLVEVRGVAPLSKKLKRHRLQV